MSWSAIAINFYAGYFGHVANYACTPHTLSVCKHFHRLSLWHISWISHQPEVWLVIVTPSMLYNNSHSLTLIDQINCISSFIFQIFGQSCSIILHPGDLSLSLWCSLWVWSEVPGDLKTKFSKASFEVKNKEVQEYSSRGHWHYKVRGWWSKNPTEKCKRSTTLRLHPTLQGFACGGVVQDQLSWRRGGHAPTRCFSIQHSNLCTRWGNKSCCWNSWSSARTTTDSRPVYLKNLVCQHHQVKLTTL